MRATDEVELLWVVVVITGQQWIRMNEAVKSPRRAKSLLHMPTWTQRGQCFVESSLFKVQFLSSETAYIIIDIQTVFVWMYINVLIIFLLVWERLFVFSFCQCGNDLSCCTRHLSSRHLTPDKTGSYVRPEDGMLTHRVFSRRNPTWHFFSLIAKGILCLSQFDLWNRPPWRAPTLPDSAGPFWHIHAVMLGCTLAGMAAFRYTWISIVSSTLGMCSSSIFLLYIPPHIHHSLSSLFVFHASVPTTSRQPIHPPNPFPAFSCFTEPR